MLQDQHRKRRKNLVNKKVRKLTVSMAFMIVMCLTSTLEPYGQMLAPIKLTMRKVDLKKPQRMVAILKPNRS